MYVCVVYLGAGKGGIFIGKIRDIGWGEINMFILEDLHNSLHKKPGLVQEKTKKGRGGRESDWNCPVGI